jgi:hypothetical protein
VLFHGEVLQKEVEGKSAKAIQAFNELVAADETVEKVMLTIRDGLFVHPKKVKPIDDQKRMLIGVGLAMVVLRRRPRSVSME